MNHFRVTELDEGLGAWIREAYEVGAGKRLLR